MLARQLPDLKPSVTRIPSTIKSGLFGRDRDQDKGEADEAR